MKFTVRHRYGCTPQHFWSRVFFSDEYTSPLYREGLGFDSVEVQSLTREPSGAVQRRMAVRPKLVIPGPVKKLLGGALTYLEVGAYDPVSGRFSSEIIPSAGADKIKIRTEMWMEPVGQDEGDRVASFEVSVRVFGIGKVVEKFIERSLRESYASATTFTNRWLAQRWDAGLDG